MTVAGGPLGWSWRLPVATRFGRGSRADLAAAAEASPWLVVGSAAGRERVLADPVLGPLLARRTVVWAEPVAPTPDVEHLEALSRPHLGRGYGVVVGIGGGSVMDAAKVIAARLAAGPGVALRDLLDDPHAIPAAARPRVIVLPTTAGSGSEVTPFATVWDRRHGVKRSLTGEAVWPSAALVDPDLSDALPHEPTLESGLDALNQALESVWNRHASPLTVALATRAATLAWRALPNVLEAQPAAAARAAMAEAALLAGMAISQTRTALCHALSYPLTLAFGVAHGVACAFTMAAVARHVVPVDDGRLARLARDLLGSDARAADLPDALDAYVDRLGVRGRVRAAIGSRDSLLARTRVAGADERGDNLLRPAGPDVRERILVASWGPA